MIYSENEIKFQKSFANIFLVKLCFFGILIRCKKNIVCEFFEIFNLKIIRKVMCIAFISLYLCVCWRHFAMENELIFEKITISFLIRLHLQKFCNIRTYLLFLQVSQSCFNRASRNFACVIEFFNGFYQPRSKLKSMKSFIQNYLSKNWGPKFKI